MNLAKIQTALEKAFAGRRVVFWYDELSEWWTEADGVRIDGVEKVGVDNDEFTVKHRVLRLEPRRKFLLYFRGKARPADTQNWLLDLLLASGPPFTPDRASLAVIETGLPPEFKGLAAAHLEFFRSSERIDRLKELLKPDDTERDVAMKMMAVLCRTEPAVEAMLLVILGEMAVDKDDRWQLLGRHGFGADWWREIGARFGYVSPKPALLDFLLSLFRAAAPLGGASGLESRQALLFINRWKDSSEHAEGFAVLSDRAAGQLNVAGALHALEDVRPLLRCDVYRAVDLRLLADLRDGLVGGGLAPAEVRQRAEAREQTHWARREPGLKALYRALAVASELVEASAKLDLTIESFDLGIEKYAGNWSNVDRLYRKFIHYANESGQTAVLEPLAARIEGLYINEYLGKLAQRWQEWVDRTPAWTSAAAPPQREFYARFVRPLAAEGKKVFVILSDALRYEAARELLERVISEDRWTGDLRPMLGALPSFTQLGMAALLPQATLEFDPRGQAVLADGVNTAGIEARAKVLGLRTNGRATALTAEAFFDLNSKTDGRDLARTHDVVYIYHNTIDAVGDKRDTEYKTCAAVESALEEILRLLKKAAAMNVSHFVVTADHGFLFQSEPVAESDFLRVPEPDGALKFDRRFIVAPAIPAHPGLKQFSAAQLGLEGELQFAFPKGLQRLRLHGAGSRYVHGGATLQEIVLPVLQIKKERSSDVERVAVDIVRSGQQITTGQVTITFLQAEPVGDKCLPRELRAGFFAKNGAPISESRMLRFDSTAPDARQRERREQFIFGRDADQYNQQEVILRLEEPISGTSHFRPYGEFVFKLRRAFDSDFD